MGKFYSGSIDQEILVVGFYRKSEGKKTIATLEMRTKQEVGVGPRRAD